jgi:hypothetical protein
LLTEEKRETGKRMEKIVHDDEKAKEGMHFCRRWQER